MGTSAISDKATFTRVKNTIFRSEIIGLEVTPDKAINIVCFCGHRFNFAENQNKNKGLSMYADCPKCLESYRFEDSPDSYLLIRPRTNSMINVSKESFR